MIHAECGNAHLQEPPWGRAPGGLPSQWLWPSGMCRLCKAPFVPEGLEHDFRNKMTLKLRRKRRKKRIGDNINVTVGQPQDPTTATQETSRDLGALPSKGCHQVGTQGQPVACWLLGLIFHTQEDGGSHSTFTCGSKHKQRGPLGSSLDAKDGICQSPAFLGLSNSTWPGLGPLGCTGTQYGLRSELANRDLGQAWADRQSALPEVTVLRPGSAGLALGSGRRPGS